MRKLWNCVKSLLPRRPAGEGKGSRYRASYLMSSETRLLSDRGREAAELIYTRYRVDGKEWQGSAYYYDLVRAFYKARKPLESDKQLCSAWGRIRYCLVYEVRGASWQVEYKLLGLRKL